MSLQSHSCIEVCESEQVEGFSLAAADLDLF